MCITTEGSAGSSVPGAACADGGVDVAKETAGAATQVHFLCSQWEADHPPVC